MNIGIYGAGNLADYLLKRIEAEYADRIRVLQIITSDGAGTLRNWHVESVHDIRWSEIDYLVISSIKYKEEMVDTICSIYQDRYSEKVLSINGFFNICDIIFNRNIYQITSTDEGLIYISDSNDIAITFDMKLSGKTFSSDIIDAFIALSDEIRGEKNGRGYFLDIGANIGTTSIYIEKVLNRSIDIIAFEPGKTNFQLLNANIEMNGCHCICTENIGLGVCDDTLKYHYVSTNPGGSYVSSVQSDDTEIVTVMSLDSYLKKRGIKSDDISYIWLDSEGFEAKIILGASELLSDCAIPLLTEFNVRDYILQGVFDDCCKLLCVKYKSFIDLSEINNKKIDKFRLSSFKIHDINELNEWGRTVDKQTDLLIF